MIVEERIYTLKVGVLPEYRELYLSRGYDLQRSILGDFVGYYFTEIGEQNQVVHLWQYESFADRDARRSELFSHPDWLEYIRLAAPLVVKQETKILKPLVP